MMAREVREGDGEGRIWKRVRREQVCGRWEERKW